MAEMVPLAIGGEFLSPRRIFTKAELTKAELTTAELTEPDLHQSGSQQGGSTPRRVWRIWQISKAESADLAKFYLKQDGLSRLMHSRIGDG